MKPSKKNVTNTDFGAAAESKVAAEITLRGGYVSFSITDKIPYDLISDYNGKISKIQVKGIFSKSRGTYRCELSGYKNRAYKQHEVDYFVIYIHDLNDYYVIPFDSEIRSFNVNGDRIKPFKNAWWLLK